MANQLRVWFAEIRTGHHAKCQFADKHCTSIAATEVVTLEELDSDQHVTRKKSFEVCDQHAHLIDQERRILLNKMGGYVAKRALSQEIKPVIELTRE